MIDEIPILSIIAAFSNGVMIIDGITFYWGSQH